MFSNNYARLKFIKIVLCLAFLAAIGISWKLWTNDRLYPLAPVIDIFAALPAPFDLLQLVGMVSLLVLIMIWKRPQPFIIAFFGLFWLLVLGDQNRLQPYCYMYVFMLLSIAIAKDKENDERNRMALNAIRVILVGTYLWAGIHKINPYFINRFYPFLARSEFTLPGFEPGDTIRKYFILIIPVIEILAAIGLLFNRSRMLSLFTIVLMHLGLSIFLSPLGFGWNVVVIPWNIALIAINILVFWKVDDLQWNRILTPKPLYKAIIILLFLIMPFFNLFGMWDNYLSSSLYSFKIKYARIYVDEQLKTNLPLPMKDYLRKDHTGEFIETTYWMLGELNVTPYPEERVYMKTRDFICHYSSVDPCTARILLH